MSEAFSARLQEYLRRTFPDRGGLEVRDLIRLPGGASRETWAYQAVWRDARGHPVQRSYILRRDPNASLLVSDRRMEFQVLAVAKAAGLPVATVDVVEEDPAWLERPFLIMERVSGTASRPALFSRRNDPHRAALAEQFVNWLAFLHRIDWRAHGLEFLDPPPSGQAAARRQVDHWAETLRRDAQEPHLILEEAIRWLYHHLPKTDRIVWVHADYRAGNIMFDGDRITAVLDWELCHLGDPMEDLGWACMRFWGNGDLISGLMSRDEFFARYAARSGIPVDWDSVFFYEVLGNVKMAVLALSGVLSFVTGRTEEPLMAYLGCLPPALEADLMRQLDW